MKVIYDLVIRLGHLTKYHTYHARVKYLHVMARGPLDDPLVNPAFPEEVIV